MRTARAIGLGLLISAGSGGAAWAQGEQPEGPRDVFGAVDKDGDGKVSRDELRGLFDRVDADKDGFITKDEAAKFRPRNGEGRPDEARNEEARPRRGDGEGRPDERSEGEARPGAAQILERLKAQDKDGDGKLSRDEYQGPEAFFDRLDANKDGSITKDEVAQFASQAREQGPQAILERLKAQDKDGDGKLSRAEYQGPEAFFDRLDANKDGSITKDEVAQFARQAQERGPQAILERLKAQDKDGDGKLSRAEFQGPEPLFDRLDANSDGSITKDEVAQFAERAREGRPGQDERQPPRDEDGAKPVREKGDAKPVREKGDSNPDKSSL